MTSGPNYNEDPNTEGKIVPPYVGRQESGDLREPAEADKEGVRTGGATGPVQTDETEVDDPEETERGAHASPADEQPPGEVSGDDSGPEATGPAHQAGTARAEDQS
jgi:hypothetical protein